MGYFERFLDTGFQRSSDGELIYYPLGVLSKGYIVPDAAKEQELRRKHKLTLLISLIAVVIVEIIIFRLCSSGFIPFWLTELIILGAACLLMACNFFILKRWVMGLQPAARKFSIGEAYRKAATATHPAVLWRMEIFSLLFLFASIVTLVNFIWRFFTSPFMNDSSLTLGLIIVMMIGIPVWGLCAFIFAYMIRSRAGN